MCKLQHSNCPFCILSDTILMCTTAGCRNMSHITLQMNPWHKLLATKTKCQSRWRPLLDRFLVWACRRATKLPILRCRLQLGSQRSHRRLDCRVLENRYGPVMLWQTTIFREATRECFQESLLEVTVLEACGTWPKLVMTGTLQMMFSAQRLDCGLDLPQPWFNSARM